MANTQEHVILEAKNHIQLWENGTVSNSAIEEGKLHVYRGKHPGYETIEISPHKHLVLSLPNFSKQLCTEYDVSGTDIGAVLSQDKKAIAFFSKTLADTSLAKSIYEKELMTIALAI